MKISWAEWGTPVTGGAGDLAGAQGLGRTDYALLALLMLVFWCGVLRQIDLPGLYMDSVFPDYLAARALNPGLKNPVWALPTATVPILGGLYHGVQNLYVGMVVFVLLGISVTSIRIAQALFGAAIVILLYLLTYRITGRRAAAFVGALLLATEIAFLASFRSQFYIILSAEAWLFASLVALWRGGRIGHLLSGVFFGLAIYGYFVLGFFLPAIAILIMNRKDRQPLLWMAGIAAGLLPYVAGYASLVWALGGPSNALAWLNETVRTLAPFSSKLGLSESLTGVWDRSLLALTNAGNELMLFGEVLGGGWSRGKAFAFVAITLLAALACHRWRALCVALLPLAYVAVAAFFGSRLWAHHFVVLVPLSYLVLAVAIGLLPLRKPAAIGIAIVAGFFVVGNLHQSNRFHERLNETGGARMASNALSQFAEEARRNRDTLYVFPDWGFFTSFALLTENRIPYLLDASAITSARGTAERVVIAFWNDRDEEKYASLLMQAGARETATSVYRQRDGRPAFLVVSGRF